MGDPRKHRKKFVTPGHPWERSRIEEERTIRKKFGLKTKKEIWKMQSILRNFKIQAKDLIKRTDEEAKKQEKLLMEKLVRMRLFDKETEVEKILDLSSEDIMNRRLQSIVFKQNLAHSMKQARQFIVHGHITIDNQVVDVPSHVVKKEEEAKIRFKANSPLKDADHPERKKGTKEEKKGEIVKPLKKVTGKVAKEKGKKPEEKVAEAKPEPLKEESVPEEPKEPEPPKEEEKLEEVVAEEVEKEDIPKKKTDEEVAKEVLKQATEAKMKAQEASIK